MNMNDLYPGDIIRRPTVHHPKVKFRVRERNGHSTVHIQYCLQLYSSFPAPHGQEKTWGWHRSENDHYYSPEELEKEGWIVLERKPRQLKLF